MLKAFDFGAPVVGALRYGERHINNTFVVHTQPENLCCRRFVLQRMSASAFRNPDQLMENIVRVTEYLGHQIQQSGGPDCHHEGGLHSADGHSPGAV